jgi:hypothetical protein
MAAIDQIFMQTNSATLLMSIVRVHFECETSDRVTFWI